MMTGLILVVVGDVALDEVGWRESVVGGEEDDGGGGVESEAESLRSVGLMAMALEADGEGVSLEE